jgi:hypothetical protein
MRFNMTGIGRYFYNVPFSLGLLPNSTKLEILDMIKVGCLAPAKEEAAYDGKAPVCS